jgi:hypothetical protein
MTTLASIAAIAVAICGGIVALAVLALWAAIMEAARTADEDGRARYEPAPGVPTPPKPNTTEIREGGGRRIKKRGAHR